MTRVWTPSYALSRARNARSKVDEALRLAPVRDLDDRVADAVEAVAENTTLAMLLSVQLDELEHRAATVAQGRLAGHRRTSPGAAQV